MGRWGRGACQAEEEHNRSSSVCWDAVPLPGRTTGVEGSKLGEVPWCQVADDLDCLALCFPSDGELFRFRVS